MRGHSFAEFSYLYTISFGYMVLGVIILNLLYSRCYQTHSFLEEYIRDSSVCLLYEMNEIQCSLMGEGRLSSLEQT